MIIDASYGSPDVKPPLWAIDPGVVAYNAFGMGLPTSELTMPFWEKAGNKVYSINIYEGLFGGTAKWLGEGIEFSGASSEDYVSVAIPNLQAKLGTSGTIFCGYQKTQTQYYPHLFSCGNGLTSCLRVDPGWSASPSLYINGVQAITHSGRIDDGKMHYVVFLWDTNTNYSAICIDGKLETSSTAITSPTLDTDIIIGNRSYLTKARDCDGIVPFFYVWSDCFTSTQVKTLNADPYGLVRPIPWWEWAYVAPPPVGAIMNQFQGKNLGADLFNGTLL